MASDAANDLLFQRMTFFKYQELYYSLYRENTHRLNTFLSGVSLITSAASIASWGIWAEYKILWIVILSTAQVLQVLRPLMSHSKQLIHIGFYLSELRTIIAEMENDWIRLAIRDDDYVQNSLSSYNERYAHIKKLFLDSVHCPDKKRLMKGANRAWYAYFNWHTNL